MSPTKSLEIGKNAGDVPGPHITGEKIHSNKKV